MATTNVAGGWRILSARLAEQDADELLELARQHDRSASAQLRIAVREHLGRERARAETRAAVTA